MSKGRIAAVLVAFTCLLALPASASAMKFAAPTGSPITGVSPYVSTVVSADFNNDGRDDLASSTSTNTSGIAIRLAQSDGTWSAATSVDSSHGAYSVAAGDFNNDNRVDLVVYRTQGEGTRAFFGNGDGTFGSEVAINAPWNGSNSLGSWNALTTGDLNNDGNDDIVFPLSNGDFAVSLSNGSGGFSTANASYVTDAPSALSDKFSAAGIGDFNDDGHADIALGTAPTNLSDPTKVAVFVMLGDGAGNFTQAATHGFQISQPEGYEGKINSLTVGSFNGDGADDIAVATDPTGFINSPGKGTVQIFLGSSSTTLAKTLDVFQSDNRPGAVIARDFDNDNWTDLAYLERTDPNGPPDELISILRGNGEGSFQASPSTTFQVSSATVSSTDLVSGDFNNDGAWDFAVGYGNSGTIRLMRNQIDPTKNRDSIDFGDVVLNSGEKQQGVVIGNAGGPTATVGQVTITGTDASAFTLPPTTCAGQPIAAAFGSCLQNVKFTPTDHRSYSAILHVTFNNSAEVLDVPISANVVAPAASFSPFPIDFDSQFTGSTSTRTLTITSTGDAVLFISNLTSITGDDADHFSITNDGCSNRNLAPNDSCTMELTLNAGSTAGHFANASLNVDNDGYLSPQSVDLEFDVINPQISVSPASENFGPVNVGSSEFQTFTITSSGSTTLALNDFLIANDSESDFEIVDNDCPDELPVDETCDVEVEFSPNSGNTPGRNAQLQIGTNAQVATKVIPLSGTALQGAGSLDTGDFQFDDTPVGSTSSKTITVTSNGNAPLQIESTWVDGPYNEDNERFSISNDTCSNATIPVGQTCSWTVNFGPDERRDFLAYTGAYNPDSFDETVEMTGNGTSPAAEFDVQSFDFGSATIGLNGLRSTRTFSLTSTGLDPVTVQSLKIEGPDPDAFDLSATGVCSAPIPPNETCQITVTFDPKSGNPGSRAATLTAETTGGVVEVALTGNAVAAPTFKASVSVKAPKKARLKNKKFKLKVSVTVKNTGTGTLSGATLKYKATQGKTGKAKAARSIKLPDIPAGKTRRKNITINIRAHQTKRGKPLKSTVSVVHAGKTIASRSGTTKLDFGQAKSRRPRDISNS